MSDSSSNHDPSTPDATSQVAQSREGDDSAGEPDATDQAASTEALFTLGDGVMRQRRAMPYGRKHGDPVYRPLRIFALDPAISKLDGAIALVNVPYEQLGSGPTGDLFEVIEDLPEAGISVNLDDPRILITQGRAPSTSDYQFHQQMVYAVCSSVYSVFKAALGRDPDWGFIRDEDDDEEERARLKIRPHAFRSRNAYYDKQAGELCFGWFEADARVYGHAMPKEIVYTCLSHDIIVHELTHALLDGMRTHFTVPTRADVPAFHEAFADLVAIFQHFSYQQVVLTAIRKSRGTLTEAPLLTDLAQQFGRTSGRPSALRSAIDEDPRAPLPYDATLESHKLGSVLVSAVFEAFNTVFVRKVARYVRLATSGSGILPLGELPEDLKSVLAEEASQLASQFLAMCIRAIDYCPPVDLEFGEFLRAVITADYDLVPDDPWAYREAWIDSFRRRGIYPRGVPNLAEDVLLWRGDPTIEPITGLCFAELKFKGDPAHPAGVDELHRQATALGKVVGDARFRERFGLSSPQQGLVGPSPTVESIRSSRRVGPDGQVVFDLVAEVTQRTIVPATDNSPQFISHGGSTIILGPDGDIRYVVGKGVLSESRLRQQQQFITSPAGHRFWETSEGSMQPRPNLLQRLHDPPDHSPHG